MSYRDSANEREPPTVTSLFSGGNGGSKDKVGVKVVGIGRNVARPECRRAGRGERGERGKKGG